MESLTFTTVPVSGMTCGHCIASVTEELSSLPSVREVDVKLNAGGTSLVTIGSEGELAPDQIGEAIAEAGYVVVSDNA